MRVSILFLLTKLSLHHRYSLTLTCATFVTAQIHNKRKVEQQNSFLCGLIIFSIFFFFWLKLVHLVTTIPNFSPKKEKRKKKKEEEKKSLNVILWLMKHLQQLYIYTSDHSSKTKSEGQRPTINNKRKQKEEKRNGKQIPCCVVGGVHCSSR